MPLDITGRRPTPLLERFRRVRALSLALVARMSDADASAQSMPDASPAKWHLAHTTWFLETFILRDHVAGHVPFDRRYAFLFNSYYEAEGDRLARPARGLLTRPSLDEIRAWRAHVDAAIEAAWAGLSDEVLALVELGCHHEEQHQELLMTDILHLFSLNPLAPALFEADMPVPAEAATPLRWIEGAQGAVTIGHDADGFAFDCETPRHTVWLAPHALADRLVTNGEWREFIADGGYRTASLWLSDGWAWARTNAITAPLYWRGEGAFGLDGLRPLDDAAPVSHISYFEADAFAHWAGARLPTEAEWESAASGMSAAAGLDTAHAVRPRAAGRGEGLRQMFGEVWQWTASAYLAYPGFRPATGAIGEYNGKFMNGQFVLRGSSCATPRGHSRATYRNFFQPHQRWQFSGLRLARDL
ncbi:ergothioneine biosynthesis protein EgtB [Endobacter medicaginis]|uniref:Ergothioneine biosynthesis protein EgtB n=3 Tax=Endobacter medicaginis TaxID=1181271 RepID=A0A839UXW8_9PROT|nr:ergothioneine biosynthesis protein EgtB [Endobacter medicaginis]MBB3173194.1 ergothioneine biosynthesis protein EgtB [Endobacter medicaginis]MCX5476618.1 ergothioneine biosynthesis protein EgtB [Endobacter medicaginis]